MAIRTLAINNERDIITTWKAGREMARELGFSSTDQTRLATASMSKRRSQVR